MITVLCPVGKSMAPQIPCGYDFARSCEGIGLLQTREPSLHWERGTTRLLAYESIELASDFRLA